MLNDGFENLKRAWLYVRTNRFLWPIAFVIALAGGGSQGFSLWVQSPISRSLTALSPIHRIGQRITDFAHGNLAFWSIFLVVGFFAGLIVVALGAFAQAAAIWGVSDVEHGRPAGLAAALRVARDHFVRVIVLVLGYLLLVGIITVPSLLFFWTVGKKGFVLPCLAGLVLGVGLLVASVLLSVMLELSLRYAVLDDRGIVESVQMAGIFFKEFWREVALTWLYVTVISIMGTVVMAIVLAVLATPLSWIFNAADVHHNAFIIAASIVAFILAWAVAAAFAGIFSILGSAMWTLTFNDLV